jgi:hypothetical protein
LRLWILLALRVTALRRWRITRLAWLARLTRLPLRVLLTRLPLRVLLTVHIGRSIRVLLFIFLPTSEHRNRHTSGTTKKTRSAHKGESSGVNRYLRNLRASTTWVFARHHPAAATMARIARERALRYGVACHDDTLEPCPQRLLLRDLARLQVAGAAIVERSARGRSASR